jgi:hypothetical protein
MVRSMAFILMVWVAGPAQTGPSLPPAQPLVRAYRAGEVLTYRMQARNQDREGTLSYEATATVEVQKNAAGQCVESIAWSDYTRNGKPVPLNKACQAFRQILSRSPGWVPSLPNLAEVKQVEGPVLDLLTFYVDLFMASLTGLTKEGDHRYFPVPMTNSWAAGESLLVAEDSVDFDLTLQSVDTARQIATLLVKHVPPKEQRVKLQADWMKVPVAAGPNNWVQVARQADGSFLVEVGQESFEVVLRLDLTDGKILSAVMDNPVEVRRRVCKDAALVDAGEPLHYTIHRHIELALVPSVNGRP